MNPPPRPALSGAHHARRDGSPSAPEGGEGGERKAFAAVVEARESQVAGAEFSASFSSPRSVAAARVAHVIKCFGRRSVLSDVSLIVEHGQVHALVGANGAGKSSLVKILAGYYTRDAGDIFIDGAAAPQAGGVAKMAALGVRVVHQDLGLIDGLSVVENIAAGDGYVRARIGIIDWRATAARVAAALELVGVQLDPWAGVSDLPTWQRVAVASARALYDGLDRVRLLILDEVTAALPPGEVALILSVVRRLQASGAGILYVTHRFEEVLKIADWVTALRNGEVAQSQPIDGVTAATLVENVAGHGVLPAREAAQPRRLGAPVLEMRSVCTDRLHDITLSVQAGEICGIVGRAGCGRSALGRTVFGQERVLRGSMFLNGTRLACTSAKAAIDRGIAYVPQDRQRAGIFPGASLRENLVIGNLDAISRFGIIDSRMERRLAQALAASYAIVPADIEEQVDNFSGGNQQKAVVGRWGRRAVVLFVLDEPTEGVDVAARESIYQFIRSSAKAGAAILLLSSSIEEVVETCDRALVLREGGIAEEVTGEQLSVRILEHLVMASA